ncbi:hypothetical protein AB0N05_16310 [Nocardia sp. NPDC051030]|uniref:hypothetical protein n=1 Tax=Nocardia sp. NPDC051030 TaxID=3155162 RepID=UPI00341BCA6C
MTTFPVTTAPSEGWADPAEHLVAASALGMGKSFTFPGRQHEMTLTLPVLPGLVPSAIVGTIQLPPKIARGTLDVHSGARLLDRVPLPNDPKAPVRLSLAGAEVEDDTITVTLSTALVEEPGTCVIDWLGRPTTLSDPAIVYFGEEVQPTTVADFLPAVLQRLTIYVPSEPTETESAAALSLGTAVIARYNGQPVVVELRKIPAGGQADHAPAFLERQIAITESSTTGLSLATGAEPVLTIAGDKNSLPDQIRLLTSDLTKIALATKVRAQSLPAAPQIAPEAASLSELGQSQLSSTGFGAVRVDIGIDQARLGRAAKDVRVRLLGNYTPLPNTMNGQITVRVGSHQLDSWPVSGDGRIERWIDIPDEVLGRFTTLSVTLQQTGLAYGCGLEQPITLTIDPDSEVTSRIAKPPVPGGFQALPQGLLPQVDVGLRTPGFADTVRAATILNGLQRLTSVPMRPELVSFDTAVRSSKPAILITANGDVPASIRLPLAESEDVLTVSSHNAALAELKIDPAMPFGSLQTTWSNNRTVVVATSTNAPEHLDRALAWLDADLDRWTRLEGSVLFQAGDREPEFFDPAAAVTGSGGNTSTIPMARILTIVGGVVLGLGVLLAAFLLLGRRRRR